VLRETTSRGLCGLGCPSRTSERGGEGDCVIIQSCDTLCVCLLLQDLVQRCLHHCDNVCVYVCVYTVSRSRTVTERQSAACVCRILLKTAQLRGGMARNCGLGIAIGRWRRAGDHAKGCQIGESATPASCAQAPSRMVCAGGEGQG
jgi:hypothetical protein